MPEPHHATPTPPLSVAMIGVGDITDLHLPAYRDFDTAKLVALCDVDGELLQRRRREWGVERITTDYEELLADPSIDIVEVNTPHHLHERLVVDALGAGKHVQCQKPIATSVGEAERMMAAAEASTGTLRIFENFVYYPPYVKAKELLDGGEIGELLTIRFKLGTGVFGSRWIPLRAELWHLLESEKGMGQAVFDDGYHKLSMAIHLGGAVDKVQGFVDRSFKYADMPAQLIWRYEDSTALGSFDIALSPSLYTSSKYFPADERIDIVGTEGTMHLTCCTARITDDPPLILVKGGRRYLFDDLETDWQASFTAGIRDFPLALVEGREALLSGRRATDIMQLAFAIIIAAKTGTEVAPRDVSDDMLRRELGMGGAR